MTTSSLARSLKRLFKPTVRGLRIDEREAITTLITLIPESDVARRLQQQLALIQGGSAEPVGDKLVFQQGGFLERVNRERLTVQGSQDEFALGLLTYADSKSWQEFRLRVILRDGCLYAIEYNPPAFRDVNWGVTAALVDQSLECAWIESELRPVGTKTNPNPKRSGLPQAWEPFLSGPNDLHEEVIANGLTQVRQVLIGDRHYWVAFHPLSAQVSLLYREHEFYAFEQATEALTTCESMSEAIGLLLTGLGTVPQP